MIQLLIPRATALQLKGALFIFESGSRAPQRLWVDNFPRTQSPFSVLRGLRDWLTQFACLTPTLKVIEKAEISLYFGFNETVFVSRPLSRLPNYYLRKVESQRGKIETERAPRVEKQSHWKDKSSYKRTPLGGTFSREKMVIISFLNPNSLKRYVLWLNFPSWINITILFIWNMYNVWHSICLLLFP